LVACGGGGGGPPSAFTVSGAVSGLVGTGLVLRDNVGDDLPVAADGAIAFPTKIASGATYSVTVFAQPTSPAQTCVVTHGSGTMGSNDVANVAVACTLNPFTGFVSGPYRYTEISSSFSSSSNGASSGPIVYDGVGGYSGSYVLNTLGVISSGSISGPYTAAVGGEVTLGASSGAVSADGNTIVSANLQAGNVPSVDVEIKQGQTNFTNADFTGIYQVVSIDGFADSGSSLTLTADGAGSYSGNLGVITNGAVSGTYSVAADGSLTITPASGSPLSGGISADGRTLVLSQLTAGQLSAFAVGIKQGQTNFTNADVVGTYKIVNYTRCTAELATLDFDGAGNFNGTTTRNGLGPNLLGTISDFPVTGTYTVAADGTLTVVFLNQCNQYGGCHGSTSVVFTGGVSSDGNTLVLSYANPRSAGFPLTVASVGVRL